MLISMNIMNISSKVHHPKNIHSLLSRGIVSLGLATYTTLKTMQVAGLILSLPSIGGMAAIAISTLLTVGCLMFLLREAYIEVTDENLKNHLNSTTFASQVFIFRNEGETCLVRIMHNRKKQGIEFNADHTQCWEARYLIAFEKDGWVDFVVNKIKSFNAENFEMDHEFFKPEGNLLNPVRYTAYQTFRT